VISTHSSRSGYSLDLQSPPAVPAFSITCSNQTYLALQAGDRLQATLDGPLVTVVDRTALRRASAPLDPEHLLATARQQYQAGDLKGAVELLRQCYATTHDPNLLFNIAQVYRELKDCMSAREHYRRYIEEAPDGERVADARKHIAMLNPTCPVAMPHESPADLKAGPTAPPPTAASLPANHWPTVAWISFGTSVLAAAATTYFAAESYSAKRDVERIQQQPTFDARYLNTRLDDFYRDRNWATGAAITSGVTLVLGVYSCIATAADRRRLSESAPSAVFVRVDSVDLRWRF